jgi:predicted transcriptional regulator
MNETKKTLNEFYEMKVKDIMYAPVEGVPCIIETSDVSTVFTLISTKGHVWVMSGKDPKHPIGVITESDTMVLFSPLSTMLPSFDKPDPRSLQYGETVTAEEIMSKKPVTTTPDENLKDVLQKMKEQKIKQLPVVDENAHLIGEISLSQLIQEYSKHFSQKSVE